MFTFRKFCILGITWILLMSGLNPTTTTLTQSAHAENSSLSTAQKILIEKTGYAGDQFISVAWGDTLERVIEHDGRVFVGTQNKILMFSNHHAVYAQSDSLLDAVYDLGVNENGYLIAANGSGGLGIFDPNSIGEIGRFDTSGHSRGVFLQTGLAFVADGENGLVILDVSDPVAPTLVGSLDTPGFASGITVSGSYAYVADGKNGLRIINIATPAAPFETGSLDTPGDAQSVVVSDDLAYVCDGWAGIRVINISDPAAPVEIGSYDTPGIAREAGLWGSYLSVADGPGGYRVLDVTNPAAPVEAAHNDSTESVSAVAVNSTYALVSDGEKGLYILDLFGKVGQLTRWYSPDQLNGVAVAGNYAYYCIGYTGTTVIVDASDPANPAPVGSYTMNGRPSGIQVVGDYAYIADNAAGLVILNIADKSKPALTAQLATHSAPRRLGIYGNLAYVMEYNGMDIINIAQPSKPVQVGSYEVNGYYGAGSDVKVEGNYAYLAMGGNGMVVLDVSDPTKPTFVGDLKLGKVNAVDVAGHYAYVGIGENGGSVRVVDIANPAAPVEVGRVDTTGSVNALAVVGNTVYAGQGFPGGLNIIDVSDLAHPALLHFSYSPNHDIDGYSIVDVMDVAVSGNYVYTASTASSMVIYKASGLSPAIYDDFPTPNTPSTNTPVTAYRNFAYQSTTGASLLVYDVSDKTAPVMVNTITTPGKTHHLRVLGDKAYLADGPGGLLIYSLIDPVHPALSGSIVFPGLEVNDVFLVDHTAYIAASSTLQIVDISDPTNPIQMGSLGLVGLTSTLSVIGNYAYVASDFGGLIVVDISVPSDPLGVGKYCLGSYSCRDWVITIRDKYAYILGAVFQIIDLSNPAAPVAVGEINTFASDFVLKDNFVFLVRPAIGLEVWDISNPSTPVLINTYPFNLAKYKRIAAIELQDNFAYLAGEAPELLVLNLLKAKASAMMPVGGGSLSIPGGGAAVTIPEGAYSQPVAAQIRQGYFAPKAVNRLAIGTELSYSATDLQTLETAPLANDHAIRLDIPYTDAEKGAAIEETLSVYKAQPSGDWTAEPSSQLDMTSNLAVGSSRVDLQACKLEYSIVSPK